jgi:hypothetical protein
MERREFIALIGMAAAAMPAQTHAAAAHPPDSLAGRLVGTWSFTSSVNTRRDGSTFDRWGGNPKGILMLDAAANYALIIAGSESRVFGAKMFFAFGTYSVDEAKKLLVTRIESCSAAKLNGTVQNRVIVSLTPNDLKYSNPVASLGSTAEVRWKRIA